MHSCAKFKISRHTFTHSAQITPELLRFNLGWSSPELFAVPVALYEGRVGLDFCSSGRSRLRGLPDLGIGVKNFAMVIFGENYACGFGSVFRTNLSPGHAMQSDRSQITQAASQIPHRVRIQVQLLRRLGAFHALEFCLR